MRFFYPFRVPSQSVAEHNADIAGIPLSILITIINEREVPNKWWGVFSK